ncbi:putative glycoside hydrolase [Anaerolineales bacterium HSG25]|nr:putative glycoside hydrolase [Anaerolineales bacterium HSG25]
MSKLFELYLRFMVWLGADAPEGYEYLLGESAPKQVADVPKPPPVETKPVPPPVAPEPEPIIPALEPLDEPMPEPIVAEEPFEPATVSIEALPELEALDSVLTEPELSIDEDTSDLEPSLDETPSFNEEPQTLIIDDLADETIPLEPEPIAPPPIIVKPEPTEPEPEIASAAPTYQTDPDFPPIGSLEAVRALYMSYSALGQSTYRQRVLGWLDSTELNAVVIDAKSDNSLISYSTQIPIAKEIGADTPSHNNFADFMAELKKRRVYTVARIVTFKDHLFAKNYPEYAVKTQGSENLWQDSEGQHWNDPFLTPGWGYNLQIAVEAAQLGFDEIQFDYLRFPTASQHGEPYFSQNVTRDSRVSAITSFLSMARGQLSPFQVKIAADIFGYTCWRRDDTLIGQDIERLAPHVDVLCPMLYPSTFNKGIPGYKNAIAHPYEVVYRSAERAIQRINGLNCTVRPWIQDFPDHTFDQRVYGKQEIQQQIKGCFDSGSEGFMVWNSDVNYTSGAYAPMRIK